MQQLTKLGQSATVLLIRHGQASDRDSEGNVRMCGWLDVPLTVRGMLEAERLRDPVSRLGHVSALYTSPLRRAVETARPVAQCLGLHPRPLASLREISCGDLEGIPVRDVQRLDENLWRSNLAQDDDTFRWPGGESYRAFRARVLRAIECLARRHAGGTIVLVTHAGVIGQLLGSLLGESAARWELFRPGNASITEVSWTANSGVLVRFDDRRHLSELGSPEGVRPSNDPQMLTHRSHRPNSLACGSTGCVKRDT